MVTCDYEYMLQYFVCYFFSSYFNNIFVTPKNQNNPSNSKMMLIQTSYNTDYNNI